MNYLADEVISFKVSAKDKQVIVEKAKENRMTMSSYCRNKLFNGIEI